MVRMRCGCEPVGGTHALWVRAQWVVRMRCELLWQTWAGLCRMQGGVTRDGVRDGSALSDLAASESLGLYYQGARSTAPHQA